MATTPSFATDIRPMFRDIDVAHMKPAGFDLSDYEDVKRHAAAIAAAVRRGSMPPDVRWNEEMCATFEAWQSAGCPP
jgi:hypothetical protein